MESAVPHHGDNLADTPGRSTDFPATHWSMVVRSGRTNTTEAAPALERLCRAYWYPLYAFVRRRGLDAHGAEDSTQNFFTHLFEKDALRSVDREKGKFRSFLLAALTNFLANEWNREHSQKRGGGRIVSWDAINAEELYLHEPAAFVSPEKLFERRWAFVIIDRALDRLRQEYADSAREKVFGLLHAHLTQQIEAGFYEKIAPLLNMGAGAVKVALHRLRRRFGELLRSEIAYTVSGPDEVEEEIRHLLAVIAE
jgi:RNA polymerase sigma-70 factor (ECF subfamily)